VQQQQAQQQQDSSTFSWTKHWWPVTPLSYLDPKKPVPVTLLGHTYVVWFDPKAEQGEGKWRLMEDRCPHRCVEAASSCAAMQKQCSSCNTAAAVGGLAQHAAAAMKNL
jgi:hypothetical protein